MPSAAENYLGIVLKLLMLKEKVQKLTVTNCRTHLTERWKNSGQALAILSTKHIAEHIKAVATQRLAPINLKEIHLAYRKNSFKYGWPAIQTSVYLAVSSLQVKRSWRCRYSKKLPILSKGFI